MINLFKRILNKIDEFIETKYFIAIMALFFFLMWATKLEMVGIILIGFFMPVFITRKNGMIAIMVIFSMIITGITITDLPYDFPNNRFENVGKIGCIIAIIFAVITNISAFVYHIIKYKPKLKGGSLYLLLPSLLLLLPILLAGVGSENYNIKQSLLIVAFMAYPLLIAIVYSLADLKKPTDFISWIIIAVSLVIILEMVMFYVKTDDILASFYYKQIELGWGYSNTIAPMLSMGFFMSMYQFTKKGNIMYFLYAIAIAIAMIFTFSRGCLLMFIFIAPISVICCIALSKKKLVPAVCFLVVILALIALVFIFSDELKKIFKYFIDSGFNESNRDTIRTAYLKGMENNWMFGQAFIDLTTEFTGEGMETAHSTLITVLASTGIFGCIFFGYYYYKKYLPLALTRSKYNLFVGLAMIVFIAYAFFDTTFYLVYQNLLVILLLDGARREYADHPEKRIKPKFIEYYKNDIVFLSLTALLGIGLAILGLVFARQTTFGTLFKKPLFDYVFYVVILMISLISLMPSAERLIKLTLLRTKKAISVKKSNKSANGIIK